MDVEMQTFQMKETEDLGINASSIGTKYLDSHEWGPAVISPFAEFQQMQQP
jgi:hypothetical protein